MKTGATCIVCGSAELVPHLDLLKKCVSCGHPFADVAGSAFSPQQLYSASYFAGGAGYFDYLADRACHERHFKARLESLLPRCPQGRLLEIGSAYGFFLNLAQRHYSVRGYEICAAAARYARDTFKVDVRPDFLSDDSVAENSVDAVVMWDVLEHLPNAADYVARSHALLKKGGTFALTTPDVGSLVARFQGRRWRLMIPPEHVHYFSAATLRRFLERQGFTVIGVSHPGYWRSAAAMAHGLLQGRSRTSNAVLRLLAGTGLDGLPIYTNLFDIVQFVARK